jgi:opacity protein-like surface antigen
MKRVLPGLLAFLMVSTTTICADAQSTYLIFKLTNSVPGSTQKLRDFQSMQNGKLFSVGTYGSYGNGVNFQAGIGKMLNPTFGFEITGEFAYGRWHKTELEETTPDYSIRGFIKEKVNTVLIKPVVVIRNSGDLLSFYTKLGIVIAPWVRKYEEVELNSQDFSPPEATTYVTHSIETARLKVGFTASFGVSFRVSQAISILGEVSGQIMSLPVSKGHYTKVTANGVDVLSNLNTRDKTWEYKESGFLDETGPDDKPSSRLYNPANYTAIGLSVGMLFHL